MPARDEKAEESPNLVGSWTSKRPRGEARSGMEDGFHSSSLRHYYFRALRTSTKRGIEFLLLLS
jgi:hypothetical protein